MAKTTQNISSEFKYDIAKFSKLFSIQKPVESELAPAKTTVTYIDDGLKNNSKAPKTTSKSNVQALSENPISPVKEKIAEKQKASKSSENGSSSPISSFKDFIKKSQTLLSADSKDNTSQEINYELKNSTENKNQINTTLKGAAVNFIGVDEYSLEDFSTSNYSQAFGFILASAKTEDYFSTVKVETEDDSNVWEMSLLGKLFSTENYSRTETNSDQSNLEKWDSFWNDWHESSNYQALQQILKNSENVNKSINQLSTSREAAVSGIATVNHFLNLFGTSSEKSTSLLNSKTVSYETYLTGLASRVTTENTGKSADEEWNDFWKEVCSTETAKEIGATFIDAAAEWGTSIVKNIVNAFTNFSFINKSSEYPGDTKAAEQFNPALFPRTLNDTDGVKTAKDSFAVVFGNSEKPNKRVNLKTFELLPESKNTTEDGKVEDSNAAKLINTVTTASEKFIKKSLQLILDSQKETTTSTVSQIFDQFVANNPLLSTHQFVLTLPRLDSTGTDLTSAYLFRVKGITIPSVKRDTSKLLYGFTNTSAIVNNFAKATSKADLTFSCDKNMDVLEQLITVAGTGVHVKDKDEDYYNLSTVSDSDDHWSNIEGAANACLRVCNGRELAKIFNMTNKEFNFENKTFNDAAKLLNNDQELKTSTSSSTMNYAKLPVFTFENFRITNLDYNLKFDTKTKQPLSVKATATWTKMKVVWEDDQDLAYAEVDTEEIENSLMT